MIDITKLRNNRFIIIFKIKNVSKVMNNIKKIRPVRQAFNLDFYYKHYIKYSFS